MAEWAPNYTQQFSWRQSQYLLLSRSANMLAGSIAYYKDNPIDFIEHWCDTYDPRNAADKNLPARMPFILFDRQKQMVQFLQDLIKNEENGLIEKARDMGATWLCCAFSVWLFLFYPGSSIGWGSRKEQLVDKIGDPDSIFQKIRIILKYVPPVFMPAGFNERMHASYMKIVNPVNGATITGEAGDNIGRGGRKLIYFKDESAHYERPELIEAALGDNTRIQVDISSVNGPGNVFHRKRESGVEWNKPGDIQSGKAAVFVMDWRDHPHKDQAWYDRRLKIAVEQGLLHIHRQEVDRDYFSSRENVIIPGQWVSACIDAHAKLGFDDTGLYGAGLDVADSGGDKNALALRKGSVLKEVYQWGSRDVGVSARRCINTCKDKGIMQVQYDSIGVGAAVKAEVNRLREAGLMPASLEFVPWAASASPLDKEKNVILGDRDTPLNQDFYANLKAQAWWELRGRFERTYRAVEEGIPFRPEEMISISSSIPDVRTLIKELSQATVGQNQALKLMVDKTPPGMKSPNMADAVVMAFWPAVRSTYTLVNL